MSEVLERVARLTDFFAQQADQPEQLGRLPDETARVLRESGVVRMLQPKTYEGYESHPVDFFRAVMEIGSRCASSGWVAGVVGVHAHELAQTDRRLQDEVWGEDPDTWVASPYAPMGQARPVEGGYVLNGRWSFSSGTDHCQWVMIGGKVTGPDGRVTPDSRVAHFVLPRGDYQIVPDSWEVIGLRGTGSKDLLVKDAFIPAHRVVEVDDIIAGTRARELGLDNPLYWMPRASMFSGVICAGTLAACQGVLGAYLAYTGTRVSRTGPAAQDPYQMAALGAAAADIQASVQHFFWDVERVFDMAATGKPVPLAVRAEVRRNQVRAVARSVAAADDLFKHAGGASLRTDQPLQRFWRDMRAAVQHANNVAEPMYNAYGLNHFGFPVPANLRI